MNILARYIIVVIGFIIGVIPALAQADSIFLKGRGITPTRSAILIRDLKTDSVLVAVNDTLSLVPASILKCVTTASLLSKVPADWEYQTPVYVTGIVSDGVLNGNLVVEGSGDPTVNSSKLIDNPNILDEITSAVVARGIDSIAGKIIVKQDVWEGPAHPESWAAADLPHYYGTGSYGFNYADNSLGDRAVNDPAGRFVSQLMSNLANKGVRIGNATLDPWWKSQLMVHRSKPIDEIMRSCMVRSDNQYAEGLLRTFAIESGDSGSARAGAQREISYWKRQKAPMAGVEIFDGSGLSRRNRVTARFMDYVLKSLSNNPYYASFFPIAGEEGTLKKYLRDTPLKGYVALKTGSMRGIQCYAGYKLDENYNPTHTIVVILNDMPSREDARETVKQTLLEAFGMIERNN